MMDGTVVAPPELEPLYRQLDVSLTSILILTWILILALMVQALHADLARLRPWSDIFAPNGSVVSLK